MKTAHFFPLLLALCPALADTAEAEHLLREGRAAEALAALQGDEGETARYWRGRALVAVGRLQEAADQLRGVTDKNPLYPYAAKALMYCAWQCPELDFPAIVTPLTISRNADIAHLATAALAEYRQLSGVADGNAALDLLRSQAGTRSELNAVLHLLEIRELRAKGQLQQAERLCRKLEQERDLPLAMRHRARLELAEIYYELERREAPDADNGEEETEDDPLHATNAHGTGEETLLHFISSNPESPLLPEAVRRLAVHHAFEQSDYARHQLKEWGEDARYPHRAAVALYIRQHLLNNAADAERPLDSLCINTALAICPQDAVTEAMLLEQARWLTERGEEKEAALYLQMVQQESPLKSFLTARLLPQNTAETAEAYLNCAAEAAPPLRRAALCNALLCALRAGDDELADRVMESGPAEADALTEVCIGFHLNNGETEAAAAELNALAELTNHVSADAALDSVYLALVSGDTAAAGERLRQLPPAAKEQHRRYFALQEAYYEQNGTPKADMPELLKEIARGHDDLILLLAERFLSAGQPQQAMELLQQLLNNKELNNNLLTEALYTAARASERIGSLPALRRAAELYEHCAATDPEAATRAHIRRAAVLARIGKTQEALQLLDAAEEAATDDTGNTVLLKLVRSTTLMLEGSAAARTEADKTLKELLSKRQQLSRPQQYMLLLHHGSVCSRLGLAEEALADYTEAISLKSPTPEAAEWDALFAAAVGAITKYEQLGRYEEAAQLAETVARWNSGTETARTAKFSKWAQYLRQTHFLKNAP